MRFLSVLGSNGAGLACTQGNFEEVASFLVESGADPNDVYTDDKGKEHNLLFDSVSLGNEVRAGLVAKKVELWLFCGCTFAMLSILG